MATKHISHLEGKTGRIYVARKGSVMVFVLSTGESYLSNCASPSNVMIENPLPSYWNNSINWECGKAEYIVFGMQRDPEAKPIYPGANRLYCLPKLRAAHENQGAAPASVIEKYFALDGSQL